MSTALINPGRIGRAVLGAGDYWKGFHELLFYSFRRLGALGKPPVRLVFLKQIYFTGVEARSGDGLAALSGIRSTPRSPACGP
jgi:hypothetical protein